MALRKSTTRLPALSPKCGKTPEHGMVGRKKPFRPQPGSALFCLESYRRLFLICLPKTVGRLASGSGGDGQCQAEQIDKPRTDSSSIRQCPKENLNVVSFPFSVSFRSFAARETCGGVEVASTACLSRPKVCQSSGGSRGGAAPIPVPGSTDANSAIQMRRNIFFRYIQ